MKKEYYLSTAAIILLFPLSASGFVNYMPITQEENARGLYVALASNSEDKGMVSKAHNFVEGIADRGIGLLANKDLTDEKRKNQFRSLLKDSFDMKTIARFSLGPYWKTATETQRSEYLKLFENMIVEVYSRRFSDYDGQKLNVLKARAEGNSDAIVFSAIVPNKGPEIKVDWRVRNKDGRMRVVDIMVEGVSMSLTQRADFASVIQRGGGNVESLLEHLRSN